MTATSTPAASQVAESADEPDPLQSPGASEVAWTLASLVPELPDSTATDLKRLLARSLSSPTSGERRQARLGLLIDLVRQSQGEVPAVVDYEAARQGRARRGETWPTHSTLVRAYGGHWLAAVRAAMRLAFDGLKGRVSDREQRHTHVPSYTADEVVEAILACWHDLGLRPDGPGPSFPEYLEWISIRRTVSRMAGKSPPRLPSRDPIDRLFGSWQTARQRASQMSS